MSLQEKQHIRCQHRKIDSNIHEFVFTESSRAAVDEYIEIMQAIASGQETDEVVHSLMDTTVGFQPLGYMFRQIRHLIQQYPAGRGNVAQAKLALICPPGPMVHGLDIMMRSFPMLRTRLFMAEERDKALAWLRE